MHHDNSQRNGGRIMSFDLGKIKEQLKENMVLDKPYQEGDQVAEVHEFGLDVLPEPKNRKANRKERRNLKRGIREMSKFKKRVYKLSKKLHSIPLDELMIGSVKFQHEVRRLDDLGMIKVPPGGYNEKTVASIQGRQKTA